MLLTTFDQRLVCTDAACKNCNGVGSFAVVGSTTGVTQPFAFCGCHVVNIGPVTRPDLARWPADPVVRKPCPQCGATTPHEAGETCDGRCTPEPKK